MSAHRSRRTSDTHPKAWWKRNFWRFTLVFFGGLFVLSGMTKMDLGAFVYRNRWGGTNYAPGTVVTGIIIAALGFLPPASWVDRWLSRKREQQSHKDR